MIKWKKGILAASAAGLCLVLTGCSGNVSEDLLGGEANYSVDISVPYATATPLPENMTVPQAIVIDPNGNVTLNDASVIEGDFRSILDQEAQTEYRSLSLGNTGLAVQALQARLKALGYFDGDVSGLFDAQTENAVRRFEQTYGTMQTGVATAKLQLKLFSSEAPVYGSDAYNQAVVSQYTVLRAGAVGSSVYALQQRLKSLGYPLTDLTGVYDEQTAVCVRLFYRAYGVADSDVANVAFQKELYSETARAYNATLTLESTLSPDVLQAASELDSAEDVNDASALTLGSSGTRVSQIQRRLVALGYLAPGGDTGVYDEPTQAAVNLFLQAVGRAPSGLLNNDMQTFLLSDLAPRSGEDVTASQYVTLMPGDDGQGVLDLQRRLIALGYASGTPNGKYGQATINAVRLYQQVNGLPESDNATAYMQSQLFSEFAPSYHELGGDAFAQSAQAAEATPTPSPAQADGLAADTLYFTLSRGATGSAVTALQDRLVSLGYLDSASGVYDEDTQRAVAAFQTVLGVPATGEASASFQRYLYSKAAPKPTMRFHSQTQSFEPLTRGDTGEAVKNLQRQLYELGYLNREDVEVVGTYDDATWMAVASAQLKMGYDSADGNASIEFQAFLYSKYSSYIRE